MNKQQIFDSMKELGNKYEILEQYYINSGICENNLFEKIKDNYDSIENITILNKEEMLDFKIDILKDIFEKCDINCDNEILKNITLDLIEIYNDNKSNIKEVVRKEVNEQPLQFLSPMSGEIPQDISNIMNKILGQENENPYKKYLDENINIIDREIENYVYDYNKKLADIILKFPLDKKINLSDYIFYNYEEELIKNSKIQLDQLTNHIENNFKKVFNCNLKDYKQYYDYFIKNIDKNYVDSINFSTNSLFNNMINNALLIRNIRITEELFLRG